MSSYTSPESLVETSWLAEHLNDPSIPIVESNEDILLGFPHMKNYDGSWMEWGNSVGVPIEKSS